MYMHLMQNNNHLNFVDSLPCAYFLKDPYSNYLDFSKEALRIARFNDRSDVIGKSDQEMPWKQFSDRLREQDKMVLNGQELVNVDPIIRTDGSKIFLITKKIPVYNETDNIIGVSGVSLELARDKFQNMFYLLCSMFSDCTDFIKENDNEFCYGNIQFTKRQAQVISCLLRGNSAGDTGKIIGLSKRTVETHLENIKNLLGCYKKSELVNHAFDMGFIELMFLKIN